MNNRKKITLIAIFFCTLVITYYIFFPKGPKQEKEKDPFFLTEEYIMSLRNIDGGFGPDPKTGNSTIESTAYAILSLKELGRLKSLNKTILEGIYNFTLYQQRWDGGFGNDITYDYSTLYHTYLAVKCLDTFNRTFILNNKYLGSYFVSQFYADGSAGDIVNTFYAIEGMRLANLSKYIWDSYTANTEFYVKSLYVLPGGFGSSMFEDKAYVYSTYFALQTLFDLGLYETDFDREIIYNSSRWITECFDDSTGGFGNRKGRDPVLDVTYWAVKCMNDTKQIIGAGNYYDKEDVENFIMSCQREGGGFVKSPDSEEQSSIMWTYYAIAALNQVHPISEIKAAKQEVIQIQALTLMIILIVAVVWGLKPMKPLKHGEARKLRKIREQSQASKKQREKIISKDRLIHSCQRCGSVIRDGKLLKCKNCKTVVCENHSLKCGCNNPNPKEYLIIKDSRAKRVMKLQKKVTNK